MYIRFESLERDDAARCNAGIFCRTYDVWYQRVDWQGYWHVGELRRVLDWFNERLDQPKQFYYRPNRKAELSGVCWFHDTASDHIEQARYMAWLLDDLGIPINEIRSPNPGRVLWQDRYQAVASRHLMN
ncbi:hypothetical protein ROA7450_02436 [Roseovarius albus]|uniref:Uncharacterized protein n=1 Tax=Roseovarius albus TaxID=1247867 RepID=A0A1X6ZFC2_9RHOB|nr:hypothetical protein [Roseovarius albus]SLN49353.1 hypothetical protein ROA7450_02436 [Roseovarius albus]